jgi:hypothetical protein
MISGKFSNQNKGLLAAILILIALLTICHISNYMYPKRDEFAPVGCEIPQQSVNSKYTTINYYDLLNEKRICDNLENANIPCPTKSNELTDEELGILYRAMYESAGLEIMHRTLNPIPTGNNIF